MFDRTQYGVKLKILNVLDECSREAVTVRVEQRIKARDVIAMLEEAIRRYGKPRYIRSDNGPEFIAQLIREWAQQQGIEWVYITPGHPWENGFIESYNGKFRDECLNLEVLRSRTETQVIADRWRWHYNHQRYHSALGYQTPAAYRQAWQNTQATQAQTAAPSPLPPASTGGEGRREGGNIIDNPPQKTLHEGSGNQGVDDFKPGEQTPPD
jgi:IS30 family transposase